VPVHCLTRAEPDGVVQAIARPDGTVILHLTCGGSRTTVRLDVSRAAQLSTGIWEAAGVVQQLTGYLGGDQPPPPTGSGARPVVWRSHPHRSAPPSDRSPRHQRRSTPVNKGAGRDADDTRMVGRRIRKARDKSLRVITGLAGMSTSILHRIEHGQRELTLSEIVALSSALKIAPSALIRLPILAPPNKPTNAAKKAAQAP
jgi:Helix-turn-helix